MRYCLQMIMRQKLIEKTVVDKILRKDLDELIIYLNNCYRYWEALLMGSSDQITPVNRWKRNE